MNLESVHVLLSSQQDICFWWQVTLNCNQFSGLCLHSAAAVQRQSDLQTPEKCLQDVSISILVPAYLPCVVWSTSVTSDVSLELLWNRNRWYSVYTVKTLSSAFCRWEAEMGLGLDG